MSMSSRSLITAGFVSGKFKADYPMFYKMKDSQKKDLLEELEKKGKIDDYAEHDEMEITGSQITKTGYPKSLNHYNIVWETIHQSIEPIYYWCLGDLRDSWGFSMIDKITDIFTAAEHSSFYGASAQRLGLAQDKVSQFLATIGKMVKDLFQLVREVRWIDERLSYYKAVDEGKESAEVALKGLWVDLVDGVVQGQRTGANILVMAQQLQFVALPDLFFSVNPKNKNEVDKVVEEKAGGFNEQVKNALKRKLFQYVVWREETFKEMTQRRKFTLQYLRQHFHTIKMYMNWVKPYLKHAEKLGADISKISEPELISAFEGSLVEIELLAKKIPEGNSKVYNCLLLTLQYRTRPQMAFAQEGGFHRGPLHIGETKITWRAYAWDEKQIEDFKKMRDKEDLELLKTIDNSLEQAMNAMGDDLMSYLDEAENIKKEEEKPGRKPEQLSSLYQPLIDVVKGFGEIFSPLIPKKSEKKTPYEEKSKLDKERAKASSESAKSAWSHYKVFKKKYGMVTWKW